MSIYIEEIKRKTFSDFKLLFLSIRKFILKLSFNAIK